ncbi:hypothetical protein [Fictibacillus sp. JL2B1089]|uniref:hypothetical protein n=1 Tax=Fictibacillus sp. JL2B1089 TaxID=3399565 RepID=UPI003A856D23
MAQSGRRLNVRPMESVQPGAEVNSIHNKRSIDCHRIMLLSSSKRDKAHQFFEREGFDGSVSRGLKKYL